MQQWGKGQVHLYGGDISRVMYKPVGVSADLPLFFFSVPTPPPH